jgi:hypothetical protein
MGALRLQSHLVSTGGPIRIVFITGYPDEGVRSEIPSPEERLAIRWPAMRELRRAAHTVYSLHYHFVFTTKYRKPVLMVVCFLTNPFAEGDPLDGLRSALTSISESD